MSTVSRKPETFEEALDTVLAEMREIMIRKQRDYSPTNITEFGEVGVVVRANDKMARLKNLLWFSRHKPKNESVYDSWVDLANYGVIAILIRREWWGLPLSDNNDEPGEG